jgi:hypothetical protein
MQLNAIFDDDDRETTAAPLQPGRCAAMSASRAAGPPRFDCAPIGIAAVNEVVI